MALRHLIPDFGIGKRTEETEEITEVPEEAEMPKVNIRIDNLNGMSDVDRVVKFLKDGSITFLKTKDMQKRDLGEFQLTIQKLKRMCTNYGFDLVGTEEGIHPRHAQVRANN